MKEFNFLLEVLNGFNNVYPTKSFQFYYEIDRIENNQIYFKYNDLLLGKFNKKSSYIFNIKKRLFISNKLYPNETLINIYLLKNSKYITYCRKEKLKKL